MKEEEMYKIIAWALRDMLGDEPFNNDDEIIREEEKLNDSTN